MSKMLFAAAVSGIALLPFAASAHTGDIAMELEGFAKPQFYSILAGNQVDLPEELIQIPDGFEGMQYNLAGPGQTLPGDLMIEWDCACAGGAMGATGAGFAGGAIGFFGTGGGPIGGMVGGAIGTAIGEGLHQGYHGMQKKSGGEPGVERIELDGMTIQVD